MDAWHLYLIRAGDGSLYTGIAKDVERRLAEHEGVAGKGAKYLRGRGPFELAFRTRVGSHTLALKAENRIKRLTKTRKEALIADNPQASRLLEFLAIDMREPDEAKR